MVFEVEKVDYEQTDDLRIESVKFKLSDDDGSVIYVPVDWEVFRDMSNVEVIKLFEARIKHQRETEAAIEKLVNGWRGVKISV